MEGKKKKKRKREKAQNTNLKKLNQKCHALDERSLLASRDKNENVFKTKSLYEMKAEFFE